MASSRRASTYPLVWTLLAAAFFLGGGCETAPLGPDDHTGMAEVVFRVAWPSPSLNRTSSIPDRTSDLAIRISKADDRLRDGTVAHVSRSDTVVTMWVEPDSTYLVEVLCMTLTTYTTDKYSPIGYGISKDLTFLPDTTNNVTVSVDTLNLTFVRNDTLVSGDTLSVALNLEIDDFWSDFSKYIPADIKCYVSDPDNLVSGNSVTLDEASRDAVGVTFEWQSEMKKAGRLEFFIDGNEGDKLSDMSTAFQHDLWTAWCPADFGEQGIDRFTILVTAGTMVVITIPR